VCLRLLFVLETVRVLFGLLKMWFKSMRGFVVGCLRGRASFARSPACFVRWGREPMGRL
jgi:hypothetical protein